MEFQYGLDEKPPFLKTLLFGFQWAALLIATVIILGKVVGDIHSADQYAQILYLRKLFFISSITLACQVFFGHRLPLLPGPSAVLLIGIMACNSFDFPVIYSSIVIGGAVVALVSMSGLLRYINRLFTNNVISIVLILIAFTLAPEILNLMIDKKSGIDPSYNLGFALTTVFIMFLLHGFLKGVLKSIIVIWAIIFGSIAYYLVFPINITAATGNSSWISSAFVNMNFKLSFHPGVIISFLFCYFALLINDLGSIESVNEILELRERQGRVKRGITITGFANMAAGFFGVIGPVNFSISPGIILSTGCASRFTMIPAAVILFILSFLPAVTEVIGDVPSVVIGAVLAYVMASQIAAGLIVAFKDTGKEGYRMENGMVIGFSIFLGTIVAFLPTGIVENIPLYLRPVLTNGFVAGVISAVFLEQILIKNRGKR